MSHQLQHVEDNVLVLTNTVIALWSEPHNEKLASQAKSVPFPSG